MLTAVSLAAAGCKVIATMRNLEKQSALLELAEQRGVANQITCMALDVTNEQQAAQVVQTVINAEGRIDLLVNNAGFAVGGYVEEVPMEAWRSQLETNFFGVVALTRAVIPHMRKQMSGRIINVSSLSGRFGFPGYAPYAASKFAVEGLSEALRHELLPFGIQVVLVEPGAFKTSIWQKGFEQIHTTEHSPYRKGMEAVLRYSRSAAENAPDPQLVANLVVRIANERAPKLRYPIGNGARSALLGKALLPWKWFERIAQRAMR